MWYEPKVRGVAMARVYNHADDRLRLLSPKQRFIVQQIALGKSNAEIGAELDVAPKTVKNYVAAILAKLDMPGNRARAALLLAQSSDAPKAVKIYLHDLSAEEWSLAEDLAKGLRASEVAAHTSMTPKAITRKRREMLRKVGLGNISFSVAAVQLSFALSGKRPSNAA
jgi:DNA-binding NarL/FixJ family response regulator